MSVSSQIDLCLLLQLPNEEKHNSITDIGGFEIAKALEINDSLLSLRINVSTKQYWEQEVFLYSYFSFFIFQGNNITIETVMEIGKALFANKTLEELHMAVLFLFSF